MLDIGPYKGKIADLCGEFGIKRLEFFGSALTDDFNVESDIDCLIEFDAGDGNFFHRYFDLKYGLEELFGRRVDVVVDSAIQNPYFREAVDHSKQLIYAA
ncbi:MAG: nucleotidyltransferase family protein [Pyrinomonadaceae bacterium]